MRKFLVDMGLGLAILVTGCVSSYDRIEIVLLPADMDQVLKELKSPDPLPEETMPRKRRSPKPDQASSNRRESLRNILLKEKREVTRSLEEQMGRQLSEDLQNRIDHVLDSGDQAMLDIAEELDLSLLEMRNKNLKSINNALRRLQEGTYGICEECGNEIPEKRLRAMPFTSLCVACQERRETLAKIEKEEDRFK